MDRSAQLGQASIPGLLWRFSLPAIVGMMAQAAYVLIDRVFVGRGLDENGIAGVTIAFPFMLVMLGFSMLAGFGGTALISIRLGEGKKAEAERVLGNMTTLMVVLCLLIAAIGLAWLDPILWLCGADESVLPYARDYLQVILLGSVFQALSFGLNAAIRGEGNPKTAMISMVLSVVMNAVLAPIFIFVLHWGMRGAVLATVIAQAGMTVWVVAYFCSRRSLLRLRLANLRLDSDICWKILIVGSPPCAMQLAASVMQSLLNRQLGLHGDRQFGHDGGKLAISVWGILFPVFMIVAMPIFGINQGAQPIIGYNYGARQFGRVKKTLEIAILSASVLTVFGFVVAMLFPGPVISLFSSKPDELERLLPMGTHAMRISMLMLPLIGFQVVSSSYFQAVGKPREAMLLMLSRQLLLLIPAVLILPHFFGLDGVWAALPAADFCSSVLTAMCLLPELRRLRREEGIIERGVAPEQRLIRR